MAKKKHSFAWSPVRRLMKKQGATIVARDAVDLLIENLESTATAITKQAITFCNHAGRKKVTKDDLLLAIKYF